MGLLITLEGGDGSGKATQAQLLEETLCQMGKPVMRVSFPNYDSESSALIRMYLAGEFGNQPTDVNPYVASTFYAADRFASYRKDWQDFYERGGIVIADRYTTSNMVHQMVKYDSLEEKEAFLDWLTDLEYEKFGLPKPDVVCLLDVPLEMTWALMKDRMAKTGGMTGDIHEKNRNYLLACHEAYTYLVHRFGWHRIACTTKDGFMRDRRDIHEEICTYLKPYLI